MEKSTEKIAHLLDLLHQERQEDLSLYNQTIMQISLAERTKRGTSWYPLQVKELGYGLGEQPFVVLEKNGKDAKGHQFGAGKMVNLFSNQPGVQEPHVRGIVNFVRKNIIKVFLYSNDFPDWIELGKIGLDLLFDDRSYREMEKALKDTMAAERNRLAEFREIFKGERKIEFTRIKKPYYSRMLNNSQNSAVNTIMAAEDLAVVHGPPGTGKTTTIVEAIRLMALEKKKVLAVAPSNTAVDWLSIKLHQVGVNVVRIGNLSRVDEEMLDLTLEARLFQSPEAKEIKKMKRQADDMRKMARKYKRNFGPAERAQRKALFQEAKDLYNQVHIIENYLVDKILNEADVVSATLVGSNNKYLSNKRFEVVVIDEAAQALEPATWIPLTKADGKVILAGDPFQLPPTVKNFKAAKAGLERTLIEQCLNKFPEVNLLEVQYRMHEDIMGFSNQQFYNNRLQADQSVQFQNLILTNGEKKPLEFIDTAGCGFEEKQNPKTRSHYNPEEYQVLWRHLDSLMALFKEGTHPSIGIISPYKEQTLYMKEQIASYFEPHQQTHIDVNTIDSFQGQERDIIYISLVRSNEKGIIGFLKDYRRMNVAMTRARKKLIVIGDSATLGNHKFYQDFMDYCEKKNAYRSAWEFMY